MWKKNISTALIRFFGFTAFCANLRCHYTTHRAFTIKSFEEVKSENCIVLRENARKLCSLHSVMFLCWPNWNCIYSFLSPIHRIQTADRAAGGSPIAFPPNQKHKRIELKRSERKKNGIENKSTSRHKHNSDKHQNGKYRDMEVSFMPSIVLYLIYCILCLCVLFVCLLYS